MTDNVNDFINRCKLMLRDSITTSKLVNGRIQRFASYENDKIQIIKSLDDYSMNINRIYDNKKDSVITLDKDGYVSKIDTRGWKHLSETLKNS